MTDSGDLPKRSSRRTRSRVRAGARSPSESGLISVSAVLGIAFLALIVYLLAAALDADTDHYGSIPVPSQNAPVELRSGGIDVYLAERGDPDELGDIDVPAGFTISIVDEDGDSPRVDERSGDTKDTDDGVTKVIAEVQVPEDGTYLVTVSADSLAGLSEPMLTFGLSPLGAVVERFEDVVDELKGTTGIIVLVALAALMLAPRVARAFDR